MKKAESSGQKAEDGRREAKRPSVCPRLPSAWAQQLGEGLLRFRRKAAGLFFRAPAPAPVRVLLCVPWFDQGGSSVLLRNVFTRLVGPGVSVTAVATNPERDPVLTNGLVHYRSFTRDCFCLATCVPQLDRARFLTSLARSRNVNLLLLVGSRLAYETLETLRAALPGLRVVDHLYNTEGHVGSNREFARHIDFHIVASETVRDRLVELGERSERIRVIHHGIDTELFAPRALLPLRGEIRNPKHEIRNKLEARNTNDPNRAASFGISDFGFVSDFGFRISDFPRSGEGPFTFGFLGRFSEEKRPQDLVELARRLPECRFLLAGDGLLRSQVAAAIHEAGLEERVILLGTVSSPLDLYRVIDALVLPSRVEGLPLVLLEAMAVEKPVIASQVGMIGSVIQNGVNGLTYESGDLDQLEAAARRLLALTPEERARMGRLAREVIVEQYQLERCAGEYLEVFHNLLPGPGTCVRREEWDADERGSDPRQSA